MKKRNPTRKIEFYRAQCKEEKKISFRNKMKVRMNGKRY